MANSRHFAEVFKQVYVQTHNENAIVNKPKKELRLSPGGKYIGIYGGSFNPVHQGHFTTAQFLLANDVVDEVRFLVNPRSPFKVKDKMPDAFHRAKMIEMAITSPRDYYCDSASMFVDNTEMLDSISSHTCYTVNTLKKILYSDIASDNHYAFILGVDVFNNIKKFKNWKWFLEEKLVDLIILPRPGYTPDKELLNEFKGIINNIDFSKLESWDVSSTKIRKAIQQGDDDTMSANLPDMVYEYIKNKKLYGYPKEGGTSSTVATMERLQKLLSTMSVDDCKRAISNCPYEIITKTIKYGLAVVTTRSSGRTIYNIYNFNTENVISDEWFTNYGVLVFPNKTLSRGKDFQWNYKKYNVSMFEPTNETCYAIVQTKRIVKVMNTPVYCYNIIKFNSIGYYEKVFNDDFLEDDFGIPRTIINISPSGIKNVMTVEVLNGKIYEYNLITGAYKLK